MSLATKPATKADLRSRTTAFVRRWGGSHQERSEAQRFWIDFFSIFGLNERDLGTFEALAKRLSTGRHGYIDYLSPGEIAIEHKSSGEDLDDAMGQLLDYVATLPSVAKPRLLVACDFGSFYWLDLVSRAEGRFKLDELDKSLETFWWLAGYRRSEEPPPDETSLNLEATDLMAQIHDAVLGTGYSPHALRSWLTRILFCLFADDAGVWDRRGFETFVHMHTAEDGSDLGPQLALLFQILDTPPSERPRGLDEDLASFTFINGDLFSTREQVPIPMCNREIREHLLAACRFDWSEISPAIFGSMFQNVMTDSERRELGAHYTSEENILRVIRPLFLDALERAYDAAKSRPDLHRLHDRISKMTFLDPACGCGNFLVIAYRELRRLETRIVRRINARAGAEGQPALDIALLLKVRVDQFYGIELEEFPSRIARTALYLMDHLENRAASAEFGQYFARFPIPVAPHITIANALTIDWADVLAPERCSVIMGNPPFVGSRMASPEQKREQEQIWSDNPLQGKLDYVTNWYRLAADYASNTEVRCAFVSTNSIAQGEQPAVLWPYLWTKGFGIDFAYATFAWTNEARGRAAVHVVIVGFSRASRQRKRLWTFESLKGEPHESLVRNISPYLTDGPSTLVTSRQTPLADLPPMFFGSMPRDDGLLSNISPDEARAIRASDSIAASYLRKLVGADEMLNGKERWCLWLVDVDPQDVSSSPILRERVGRVAAFRRESRAASTRAAADTPALFVQLAQPESRYLAVPRVSSEARRIVPMEFFDPDVIASDALMTIPGADAILFGLLASAMFNVWNRTVSGRLKSDCRISQEVTYNNFPVPELTTGQATRISAEAEKVLETRRRYPDASLSDLYNTASMPADLALAHRNLDAAVDAAFMGRKRADGEAARVAVLLRRYAAVVDELAPPQLVK